MNTIKDIYNSINLEQIDPTALHTMETEVYALVKTFEEKEETKRTDITQLLIEASAYGQETGFIMGFRYAVKLLTDCYF